MTGDVRADMDRIRAFYADKQGIRPGYGSTPRLREEGTAEGDGTAGDSRADQG